MLQLPHFRRLRCIPGRWGLLQAALLTVMCLAILLHEDAFDTAVAHVRARLLQRTSDVHATLQWFRSAQPGGIKIPPGLSATLSSVLQYFCLAYAEHLHLIACALVAAAAAALALAPIRELCCNIFTASQLCSGRGVFAGGCS